MAFRHELEERKEQKSFDVNPSSIPQQSPLILRFCGRTHQHASLNDIDTFHKGRKNPSTVNGLVLEVHHLQSTTGYLPQHLKIPLS
jgi:hypothetical protein